MIERSLSALPKRQTDGATIIRCQDSGTENAIVLKLNAISTDPVLVERYEQIGSTVGGTDWKVQARGT